ncbi:hypothetical protein Tco_0976787 [Tanacetum coccineum]|uniref:Uncharacterized protein n=1 Tax=Tanacetum coccineum TaxID=301880 RepID=A0ABQ5EI95_9ASTR
MVIQYPTIVALLSARVQVNGEVSCEWWSGGGEWRGDNGGGGEWHGVMVLLLLLNRRRLGKIILDVNFLWKEERVRLLVSSPRASTTQSYSPGPSTPPSYSPGPSTPPSYSPGPSRNVESVEEDFRVAGVINKLCEDVAAAIEETDYFIQELDVILGWVVATHKTCEDATAGGPGEGDGGEGP